MLPLYLLHFLHITHQHPRMGFITNELVNWALGCSCGSFTRTEFKFCLSLVCLIDILVYWSMYKPSLLELAWFLAQITVAVSVCLFNFAWLFRVWCNYHLTWTSHRTCRVTWMVYAKLRVTYNQAILMKLLFEVPCTVKFMHVEYRRVFGFPRIRFHSWTLQDKAADLECSSRPINRHALCCE